MGGAVRNLRLTLLLAFAAAYGHCQQIVILPAVKAPVASPFIVEQTFLPRNLSATVSSSTPPPSTTPPQTSAPPATTRAPATPPPATSTQPPTPPPATTRPATTPPATSPPVTTPPPPTLPGVCFQNGGSQICGLPPDSTAPLTQMCGCTTLPNLDVYGYKLLITLAWFRIVQVVQGDTSISGNGNLRNIAGLEALTMSNNLYITNSYGPGPLSLDNAVPALSFPYHSALTVSNNSGLVSMVNFAQGASSLGALMITNNLRLTTMANAFQALPAVQQYLFIINNTALTNMAGAFAQLTYTALGLSINGNALSTISQTTFPLLASVGGPLEFTSNSGLFAIANAFPQLGIAYVISIISNPMLATITTSFQALTAVYGQLDISSNAVLSSLLGSFSSLNTVDAYIILSNNGLTSLDYAFPALTIVSLSIKITGNPVLQSVVHAFQALQAMWTLEISYNPQLASLQGSFPQLQLAGYGALLNITGNTALTSLAGLEGITSSTASVSIVGNFVLSNISALAGIGQCSAGAPYNTVNVPVIVQVLLSTGISCNLTSWTGVCSYIAAYAANLSVSACPAS